MDLRELLLLTAFRHVINEPNVEAGYEHFQGLSGWRGPCDIFCDAIAGCLADGLIREPIRLPEGALQCHWHLELTPAGVREARGIASHYPSDPA
jgi:hypothetical protein